MKRLSVLLLACLLLSGCADHDIQTSEPVGEILPEVEGTFAIEWFVQPTEPDLGMPLDSELLTLYGEALNSGRYYLALQDVYALPEHINLYWLLAEPMPDDLREEVTQEEYDLLYSAVGIDYRRLQMDLWKFPADYVEQILSDDFGLLLSEIEMFGLDDMDLVYLEETDCFYRMPVVMTRVPLHVTEGWLQVDGTVRLHYTYPDIPGSGKYEVVLEAEGQKIHKLLSNVMLDE